MDQSFKVNTRRFSLRCIAKKSEPIMQKRKSVLKRIKPTAQVEKTISKATVKVDNKKCLPRNKVLKTGPVLRGRESVSKINLLLPQVENPTSKLVAILQSKEISSAAYIESTTLNAHSPMLNTQKFSPRILESEPKPMPQANISVMKKIKPTTHVEKTISKSTPVKVDNQTCLRRPKVLKKGPVLRGKESISKETSNALSPKLNRQQFSPRILELETTPPAKVDNQTCLRRPKVLKAGPVLREKESVSKEISPAVHIDNKISSALSPKFNQQRFSPRILESEPKPMPQTNISAPKTIIPAAHVEKTIPKTPPVQIDNQTFLRRPKVLKAKPVLWEKASVSKEISPVSHIGNTTLNAQSFNLQQFAPRTLESEPRPMLQANISKLRAILPAAHVGNKISNTPSKTELNKSIFRIIAPKSTNLTPKQVGDKILSISPDDNAKLSLFRTIAPKPKTFDQKNQEISPSALIQNTAAIHPERLEVKRKNKIVTAVKCKFCAKIAPTELSLANHIARVHPFQCGSCNFTTVSKQRLAMHRLDAHSTKHQCKVCYQIFLNKESLSTHEHSFNCRYCTKTFNGIDELALHVRETHPIFNMQQMISVQKPFKPVQEVFKCEICSKLFKSKELWLHHKKIYHRLLRCEHCNKCCFSKELFQKHIQEHMLKCKQCPELFRTDVDLLSHIDEKHSVSKKTAIPRPIVLNCSICEESFEGSQANSHFESKHPGHAPMAKGGETSSKNQSKEEDSGGSSTDSASETSTCEGKLDRVSAKTKRDQASSPKRIRSCLCKVIFPSNEVLAHFQSKHPECVIGIGKNLRETKGKTDQAGGLEPAPRLIECGICKESFPVTQILVHFNSWHSELTSFEGNPGAGAPHNRDCNMKLKRHSKDTNNDSKQPEEKKQKLSPLKPGAECRICDITFSDKEVLLEHFKQQHSTESCEICKQPFSSVKLLKDHLYKEHSVKHECEDCKQVFAIRKKLEIHRKVHKFKCEACNFILNGRDAVKSHKCNYPKTNMVYRCGFCKETFHTQKLCSQHTYFHHRYKCVQCISVFETLKLLDEHIEEKHPPKRYKCLKCKEVFGSQAILDNHRWKKHKVTYLPPKKRPQKKYKFECGQCDAFYDNMTDLGVHSKTHHLFPKQIVVSEKNVCPSTETQIVDVVEVAKYECDECTDDFDSFHELEHHKKVHIEVVEDQHVVAFPVLGQVDIKVEPKTEPDSDYRQYI